MITNTFTGLDEADAAFTAAFMGGNDPCIAPSLKSETHRSEVFSGIEQMILSAYLSFMPNGNGEFVKLSNFDVYFCESTQCYTFKPLSKTEVDF